MASTPDAPRCSSFNDMIAQLSLISLTIVSRCSKIEGGLSDLDFHLVAPDGARTAAASWLLSFIIVIMALFVVAIIIYYYYYDV